ncbi:zinc-dependent alcohol dehydrogenase [Streptomyces sp. NRRL F-5630]|uniref:zinc-dependent alcohol dehydrogenase n=3 Tax=Streptomyces sp. NRRL F-5630 TaxID=1463864 RepID=UPI003D7172F7
MRALTWNGVDDLTVEQVPDPRIINRQDAIVKVRLSSVCGSDLHLLGGYLPAMERGDVLGHEFLGDIVEVGPDVRRRSVGERVVVCSFFGCGQCWYCQNGLWSLCDNANTNPGLTEFAYGQPLGACFGYSHALGGNAGSHAEYIRVPYVDHGAFPVPEEVSDQAAVFASDAAPTGWMGADLGGVKPGDVVAVWGCGAVGQMAARAAMLLGAERVIVIDRFPERLAMATEYVGCETIDYTRTDVGGELLERSGGRGPDVCIEAVEMESHTDGPVNFYDKAKQHPALQSDRPSALREAIYHCRKGGSVFCLGVFGGLIDKFPMGALLNKGLTPRGAQQMGQNYIPMLLQRIATGELKTDHLMTHPMSLDEGPRGYDMFKHKKDGCVRAVLKP